MQIYFFLESPCTCRLSLDSLRILSTAELTYSTLLHNLLRAGVIKERIKEISYTVCQTLPTIPYVAELVYSDSKNPTLNLFKPFSATSAPLTLLPYFLFRIRQLSCLEIDKPLLCQQHDTMKRQIEEDIIRHLIPKIERMQRSNMYYVQSMTELTHKGSTLEDKCGMSSNGSEDKEIAENEGALYVMPRANSYNRLAPPILTRKAASGLEKREAELLLSNTSAPKEGHREKSSFTQQVHLYILYAMPIVEKHPKTGEIIPLSRPVEAIKEIAELKRELGKIKKALTVKCNALTYVNLIRVLESAPLILHISCHGKKQGPIMGSGEMQAETTKFFFESTENLGELHEQSEDDILNAFSFQAKKGVLPKLVFLSACYSSGLAIKLRDLGINQIISINSYTEISDKIATLFASFFYFYLFQSHSVFDSFEFATQSLHNHSAKVELCCCYHQHKENCPLLKKLHSGCALECQERLDAHYRHLRTCSCNTPGNIHLKNCGFSKELIESQEYVWKAEKGRSHHGYSNLIKICCCSPDLPHLEENKFNLVWRQDAPEANPKVAPFFALMDGILTLEMNDRDPVQEDPVLELDEELIGRNESMYQLLQLLTREDSNHRIISIVGPQGSGKHLLLCTALKYAMDRGYFRDGLLMLNDLQYVGDLLKKLNEKFSLFYSAPSYEELAKKIKHYDKAIIINAEKVLESNPKAFMNELRKISKQGIKSKLIFTSNSYTETGMIKFVEIANDLDPRAAYTIIKQKNPNLALSYSAFLDCPYIKSLTSPWIIQSFACHIQRHSISAAEEHLKKLTEGDENKSFDRLYFMTASNSIKEMKNLMQNLDPFYVLAILKSGLCERHLTTICGLKFATFARKCRKFISEKLVDAESEVLMQTEKRFGEGNGFKEITYKAAAGVQEMIVRYNMLDEQKKNKLYRKCIRGFCLYMRRIVELYAKKPGTIIKYTDFTACIGDSIWKKNYMDSIWDTMREAKKMSNIASTIEKDLNLVTDPIFEFELLRANTDWLLDKTKLKAIVLDYSRRDLTAGSKVEISLCSIIHSIQELTLTYATMLIKLNFASDALKLIESMHGFAEEVLPDYHASPSLFSVKIFTFMIILHLLKAGLHFTEPHFVTMPDALHALEKANRYIDQRNDAAKMLSLPSFSVFSLTDLYQAECNFIQAIIFSEDPEKRKDAMIGLEKAKKNFMLNKDGIGVARVVLGEAKCRLEISGDVKNMRELKGKLKNCIKELKAVLDSRLYINLLAEAHYDKAVCNEYMQKYVSANKNAAAALGISNEIGNSELKWNCTLLLRRVTEKLQKESKLFALLKAEPIVVPQEYEEAKNMTAAPDYNVVALEPSTRYPSFFKQRLVEEVEKQHKFVRLNFDVLNKETLLECLKQNCAVIQITSQNLLESAMGVSLCCENLLGVLEKFPLDELKTCIRDLQFKVPCSLVVIAIPNSYKVAEVFLSLGVAHVVYFKFPSPLSSDTSKTKAQTQHLQMQAIYNFCIFFYKYLLSGQTINDALELSKNELTNLIGDSSHKYPECYLEYLISCAQILPNSSEKQSEKDPLHDELLFPDLKEGEFIDLSQKRASCDIEKSLAPSVGRQMEIYKILCDLNGSKNVNLYGKPKAGKTWLGQKIGLFTYSRRLFKKQILFIDAATEINKLSKIQEEQGTEVSDNLVIIDNLNSVLWRETKKKIMEKLKKCKFRLLLISEEKLQSLTHDNSFPESWAFHQLEPFLDPALSLEFVLSRLQGSEKLLFDFSDSFKETVKLSKGLHLANGYPGRLVELAQKVTTLSDNITLLEGYQEHSPWKKEEMNCELRLRKSRYATIAENHKSEDNWENIQVRNIQGEDSTPSEKNIAALGQQKSLRKYSTDPVTNSDCTSRCMMRVPYKLSAFTPKLEPIKVGLAALEDLPSLDSVNNSISSSTKEKAQGSEMNLMQVLNETSASKACVSQSVNESFGEMKKQGKRFPGMKLSKDTPSMNEQPTILKFHDYSSPRIRKEDNEEEKLVLDPKLGLPCPQRRKKNYLLKKAAALKSPKRVIEKDNFIKKTFVNPRNGTILIKYKKSKKKKKKDLKGNSDKKSVIQKFVNEKDEDEEYCKKVSVEEEEEDVNGNGDKFLEN